MAILYTWNITSLTKRDFPDHGVTDAVTELGWSCTGTDADITFTTAGTCVIDYPDSSNFISYSSLTENDVVSWIPDHTISDTQEAIVRQIDMMKNTSVTVNTENLPWV